ncbi:MAG: hypothetical protein WC708_01195 [Lentisphaeria bacterium]|jgi:hypothetical protein
MKITPLDIASSLKAHFAVIVVNATDVPCENFDTVKGSIDRIQGALDLMKERVEVGKRIGKGDNLEPVVVFQPEVVK